MALHPRPMATIGTFHGCVSPHKRLIQDQFLIFLFIAAEFSMYVAIRQLVNTKEWLIACEQSHEITRDSSCDF